MDRSRVEVTLRRFESPDETRVMEKWKFEVVHIGGLAVGRATYEPGWRWSEHVGPTVGARAAQWHTSGWWYRAQRRQRWRMDGCSSFAPASCSMFPTSRTTAGWWGTSHMCPFTLWARTSMQNRDVAWADQDR
jgi:hypothetical protein